MQHVAIEGLATAGGIQGTIADACICILDLRGIAPIIKWVDNFVFFREPKSALGANNHSYTFQYDLSDILAITKPLGIPWHDISKKGQDFNTCFYYIGFCWDMAACTVTVPPEKRKCALNKVVTLLAAPTVIRHEVTSVHGTLQHLTTM